MRSSLRSFARYVPRDLVRILLESRHDADLTGEVRELTIFFSDLAGFSNMRNLVRWKARGTGPLASNVGEGGGFLRTRDDLDAPDMQYHIAPSGFYDNGLHEPIQNMFTAAPTLVSVRSLTGDPPPGRSAMATTSPSSAVLPFSRTVPMKATCWVSMSGT